MLTAPLFDLPSGLVHAMRWLLLGGVAASAFLIWTELSSKGTVHVEMAQRAMTAGPYRTRFRLAILIGIIAAAALAIVSLAADNTILGVLAGLAGIAGVAFYEDAFVRAGQSVPLS